MIYYEKAVQMNTDETEGCFDSEGIDYQETTCTRG